MGSGDSFTQLAAIRSLVEIDFADQSWLAGAVIDLIAAGNPIAAAQFGSVIRRRGGPHAITEGEAAVAAFLDDRPGDLGALRFAEALLL